MKTALLAALLLAVCIGSATTLKCNHCLTSCGSPSYVTVETCQKEDEVCAIVVVKLPKYRIYKQCMRKADAFIVETMAHHQVFTCATDLCN